MSIQKEVRHATIIALLLGLALGALACGGSVDATGDAAAGDERAVNDGSSQATSGGGTSSANEGSADDGSGGFGGVDVSAGEGAPVLTPTDAEAADASTQVTPPDAAPSDAAPSDACTATRCGSSTSKWNWYATRPCNPTAPAVPHSRPVIRIRGAAAQLPALRDLLRLRVQSLGVLPKGLPFSSGRRFRWKHRWEQCVRCRERGRSPRRRVAARCGWVGARCSRSARRHRSMDSRDGTYP